MLHIITFATDSSRLKYLKDSAQINKVHIHYLMKSSWNGYFDKIVYTKNFLHTVDDNDMVCFIDAYDVLSLAPYDEIVEKFKSYDCDLLLGSELNSFPEHYKQFYPPIEPYTTNYLYINSGGYIGYKHAISKLMHWKDDATIALICENGNLSDQAYFIEYFLHNPSNRIKLDTWQKIFQNMHWVSWNEMYIHKGRCVNAILNEKPCFIHFNGGTWQTNDKMNILPIFVQKIQDSMRSTDIFTLNEYQQIQTATCWPRKQLITSASQMKDTNSIPNSIMDKVISHVTKEIPYYYQYM